MKPASDTKTWLWTGAKQGAKWGSNLGVIYIIWNLLQLFQAHFSLGFTDMMGQMTTGSAPSVQPDITPEAVLYFLMAIALVFIVGGLIGVAPALIIGAVSGMILGGLLSHHTIALYPKARFLVGGIFGIVVALAVNIAVLPFFNYEYGVSIQSFFIAIPSITYIGVCLILSQRIPLLVERAHANETPAQPRPALPQ